MGAQGFMVGVLGFRTLGRRVWDLSLGPYRFQLLGLQM